ncbi:TATA-binding protein-associated factor 2N-like isoform X5 [Phymastichus coffea]|uniref:TATA-binding protein-associated factor 2N-like isoform X5 n=1 Tax=Phymastichus coffea TaxID=108790 RepID=UPI00273A9B80|nr:TATA-binding protein-associated factor 2N-like isoform X5 [Phymastichus coffea]
MNNLKMVSPSSPRKTKIFVGRLPENCRSDELRHLFLRFGEVTECDVMNRYGFVHMAREEDAAEAIKNLHNTVFKGATINVEQSTGKSRGRRDDRRGGPMRGGRGGRDGGRDTRPGYDGTAAGGGGYTDYNRGGGDFGGRNDFSGGYNDRGGYGQNVGGAAMGYTSTAPMGGYGPAGGAVGGYGPQGAVDYGRQDYGRTAEFGARTDYANRGEFPMCDYSVAGGGMAGDFNRAAPGPVEYGRTDNFAAGRADAYAPRADYDRTAAGPMRNGSGGVAASGYGGGYGEVGPMSGAPNYNTAGPTGYNAPGPGPQADMFSRRAGGTVPPSGGYQVGGYTEGYERADPYGPPRGGGRFPGPTEPMPPRY